MPDPFKHVTPGEEVSFSSTAFNAMLDAGRAEHQRSTLVGPPRPEPARRDGAIVRVKNETGGALASRHAVVGLGSPIFTPDDDVDAFLREVTFRGIVPVVGGESKFAILLEPAKENQVVRAFVAGVCPVKVDVVDVAHEFAEAEVGETGALVSVESGAAQILWKEADDPYSGYSTGIQWCVILFGTSCGGGA